MAVHWYRNERSPELPLISRDIPEGGSADPELARSRWVETDPPPVEDDETEPTVKSKKPAEPVTPKEK